MTKQTKLDPLEPRPFELIDESQIPRRSPKLVEQRKRAAKYFHCDPSIIDGAELKEWLALPEEMKRRIDAETPKESAKRRALEQAQWNGFLDKLAARSEPLEQLREELEEDMRAMVRAYAAQQREHMLALTEHVNTMGRKKKRPATRRKPSYAAMIALASRGK